MEPIQIAFTYAKRQLFDMQFERFEYQSFQTNMVYRWNGFRLLKWLCLILISIGLDIWAYGLFAITVSILSVEPKVMAMMKNLLYMDEGKLVVDYEYDEVNMTITRIVVTNNSGGEYRVNALATSTGKQYVLTIPVGIIDQSVPQDELNKIGLTIYAGGKLDGIEWEIFPLSA